MERPGNGSRGYFFPTERLRAQDCDRGAPRPTQDRATADQRPSAQVRPEAQASIPALHQHCNPDRWNRQNQPWMFISAWMEGSWLLR